MASKETPALDQAAFRARVDSGTTDASASWIEAIDTNWNQDVDSVFRVRFLFQETGGAACANTIIPLYYRIDTGGGYGSWTAISSSTPITYADGTRTDGDDCDSSYLSGTGTQLTDNQGYSEDAVAGDNASDIVASGHTEYEYVLTIDSASVANGDKIQLRGDGFAPLIAWSSVPEITVVEATALVKVIDETEAIAESSPLRPRVLVRTRNETEAVAEAAPLRPRVQVRQVDETEAIPETTPRRGTMLRQVDETEAIPETIVERKVTAGAALKKIVDETVAVAEAAPLRPRVQVRQVDELEAIPETTPRRGTMLRQVDELEAVAETTPRRGTMLRQVDELEAIAEAAPLRPRVQVRQVDETEAIPETVVDSMTTLLVEVVDETVGVTETVVESLATAIVQVIDETVAVPETTGRVLGLVQVVDETEAVAETTPSLRALVRVVDELEAVAETTPLARALVRVIDEQLEALETVPRARVLVRQVDELEAIAESAFESGLVERVLRVVRRVVRCQEIRHRDRRV